MSTPFSDDVSGAGASLPPPRFRPARTPRTHDVVVSQVRSAIVEGRLKPGDRLPSAVDLAGEFEVSRNAVLEALRVLERSGLISLRRGARGGAFVRALTGDELAEPLHLMMATDVPVRDMVEIRRAVEGNTAAWAAERATERELADLEQLASRWEGLARQPDAGHWQQALAEDIRFHTMVADASHNAAAAALVRGILGGLDRILTGFPYPREAILAASTPPRHVLESIAGRDPEAARERMQRHIGGLMELVLGAAPEPARTPAPVPGRTP